MNELPLRAGVSSPVTVLPMYGLLSKNPVLMEGFGVSYARLPSDFLGDFTYLYRVAI